MRPDIAQASLKTIFNADLRDYLPRVRIPVLVIQATADIAVPMAVGRYLRDRLPDARLRELPFAGHLPHMLAPAAITAEIEAFLATTDAAS
jgi:sigma-B regulation protein RsbQ